MKTSLRAMQGAPIVGTGAHPPAPRSGRALGIALALAGAALFSLKAVLVKLAYTQGGVEAGELAPITVLFLRFGFSFPAYLLILVWSLRGGPPMERRTALEAFALGLLGYHLCAWLDFAGLLYITAQLERLILFTYPAFVVVLGALFFGHRVSARGVAAIALAYSGIGIVFAAGDIASGANVALGSALVLGCAVLFAAFQLLAKGRIDRMGGVRFTCVAMMGATTGVMAHYLVQTYALGAGNPAGELPGALVGIGVAIAVFSTLLPSFFTNLALGRIGPQAVAVLAMIGPLVTIVAAVLVLGEPFSRIDALGTAVTLSGIALYTLSERSDAARHRNTAPTAVTR